MWINSRFVRLALFSMLMALWLLQIDAHASGSVQWKALGPYRSGPVRSIAVDPTNIEVIYAGTDAGVYRSIDGGLTWEPAGAGLGIARRVNTLAVDPSNPSVLYAGTNDGVYKSWNGAITWVKSSRGIAIDKTGRSKSKYEHTQVVAIAVHPSDSELLYASTTGKESLRFFKSTDGGASWESQGFYGPGSYIAFDPQIPTSIYGLYKYSTDGGESWSSYRYGDTGLPSHTGLKVDPSSAATLYAWNSIIGRDTSDEGIYKSTDGGGSWHQVRDGDAAGIWVTQSGDVYASVRGGREGDGIFAYGLHMSRDGGNLWEEVDAFPLRYGEVYAVVGPSSDRRYAGSDAGFARSTDGGRTWSVSTDGLPLAQVNSVAIGGDGSIYAGTESVGLLKLAEGGNHWTSLSDGLPTVWAGDHRSERLQPINSIYADTSGPGRLLVGVDSGIYSDGGGAGVWEELNEVVAEDYYKADRIVFDPKNPQILYAVNRYQISRSTDGGELWARIVTLGVGAGSVKHLGIAPSDTETLYFVREQNDNNDVVSRSTNGGVGWSSLRGLPNSQFASGEFEINCIAVDPSDAGVVYVGTNWVQRYKSKTDWRPGDNTIFRFSAEEEMWTGLGTGLPEAQVLSIAVDPTKSSRIYAGTEEGLYRSVDAGQTWVSVNEDLGAIPSVSTLLIDPHNPGRIYAGSQNNGLFEVTFEDRERPFFFSLSSWQFPETAVGRVSRELFEIFSSSGAEFPEVELRIRGEGADAFEVQPQRFSGRSARSVQVRFLPHTPGEKEAVLDVVYNGTEIQDVLSLRGTASRDTSGTTGRWSSFNVGYSISFLDFASDPHCPGRLYAVSSDDIYISTNWGNSWGPSPGRSQMTFAKYFQKVVVDPVVPDVVYVWAAESNHIVSEDGGRSWEKLQYGFGVPADIVFDPLNDIKYAASADVFIKVLKWSGRFETPQFTFSGLNGEVRDLAIDPRNPLHILAATDDGVYSTSDGAGRWEKRMSGDVYAVVFAPSDPQTVYGTTDREVLRSLDGGATWEEEIGDATWLSSDKGLALAVDPANPNRVYVGGSRPSIRDESGRFLSRGLFSLSNDGGETWEDYSRGLESPTVGMRVLSIFIDPFDPTAIYAKVREKDFYFVTVPGPTPEVSAPDVPDDGEPPISGQPTPDFDGDGTVGFKDFVMFAQSFGAKQGETNYDAKFDLDSSGDIGFRDFVTFAQSFGRPVGKRVLSN